LFQPIKIVQQSPTELWLQATPILVWFHLVALVLALLIVRFITLRQLFLADPFLSMLFPIMLVVLINLGIMFHFGKTITCLFDKSIQRLKIVRQFLFYTETLEYPFSEITEVQMESTHNHRGQTGYWVSIVLSSGKHIPLTSLYIGGEIMKRKMVFAIGEFLNLKTVYFD